MTNPKLEEVANRKRPRVELNTLARSTRWAAARQAYSAVTLKPRSKRLGPDESFPVTREPLPSWALRLICYLRFALCYLSLPRCGLNDSAMSMHDSDRQVRNLENAPGDVSGFWSLALPASTLTARPCQCAIRTGKPASCKNAPGKYQVFGASPYQLAPAS
jgi:hypothetical protein